MEVTSERASQDLSDAEHLVLLSSLLRKWWQIEILKIWLWLQIFVGFCPITLEPLITVQKWKIPSERACQDLSDAEHVAALDILIIKEWWPVIEIWKFDFQDLSDFGLDISLLRADNFGTAHHSASFSFCEVFSDDNFGTAHHSAKWKIPSQRSSHDLSDAENLVLISSLLRKWRQIEILKIWLPASV